MKSSRSRGPRRRGFALVVTLSLMILLTVIAVGLLTLATVSLRSSSNEGAMTAARANARLALLLAIGDLQKQLGPDTRVSATADQAGDKDGDPAAPVAQRHWAGAYQAWPDAKPEAARPEPEFLQWFVSGDPKKVTNRDFAASPAAGASVAILSQNAVGPDADPVSVPLLTQNLAGKTANGFAWWASDLNSKALVGPARELPTTFAEVRNDQQSAPASNLRAAKSGAATPFSLVTVNDERLGKMTSWKNAGLLAAKPAEIDGLFHDFTTSSSGLLTNVRAGGFRKDLSMELERPSAPSAVSTAFYTFGGETGINLQELWAYYNLYKDVRRTGGARFTTGGSFSSGTPYLQVAPNADACRNDDYFYFKQPVVTSYQLALSFQTRVVTEGGKTISRLYLVADPIVTLWNPLDVPVVIPITAFLSVKYWQVPYDLAISVNGGAFNSFPISACLSGSSSSTNGDDNYLSMRFGEIQQLVFKPGEVIKVSQPGNTMVKGGGNHDIAGKSGFNYGGGVAVPVRDLAQKTVDLPDNATIRYQLRPNNLTSGSTATDGHSVTGAANHNRHYSLYHHELYVGTDRGSNSLGIGTMAIDWDFGNKRLKYNETRGEKDPGTKPSQARLYANKLPAAFPTIANGRSMPAANLAAEKQAILLISFNAKTETSSDTATRFLSRFNPNALHVDFYDMTAPERDLLPYEFSVEPLSSWKSRFLETSVAGNAYFGGGITADDGSSFVTTHTVPREPLVSLGQFQYSFANGFDFNRPKYGYATINDREPMLPQIGHAIGNSLACPALAKDRTNGALPSGRPLADHSYLANNALWDQWFLSGISPQTINTYAKSRPQKTVLSDFLDGAGQLPVIRYKPELNGQDARRIAATYFAGSTPRPAASLSMASLISVDGMFNVNSTSVEAWKSLLGGRDGRPVVVRDANGREDIRTDGAGTPVAALLAPLDKSISPGDGSVTPKDSEQWVGRRVLSDKEIDSLARVIVKEIRKRGPFLCLSDFINRRPGGADGLAKSGAIQSALDSAESGINDPYQSNGRGVPGSSSSRFPFPAAETGALSYGSPGVVKQADILTPIAPILSARSDSFLVRGYGQKTDAAGKVIARAWCEAVVRRTAAFVDPADAPDAAYNSISTLNKTFGRHFEIVSFRWLNPSEA